MKAVLLCAGTSRRLNTITRTTPKTLINVGGKEILGRMLENLEYSGIKDIVIVVGYQKDQIIHYCQSNYKHLNISFVNNEAWYETNNAYSLILALEKINDDVLVCNGDVVCYKDLVKELVDFPAKNAMAVVRKKELNEEDMKVDVAGDQCNGNMMVVEVSKNLDIERAFGEFTGIFKIGQANLKTLKEDLNRRLKFDKNIWFESALNDACSHGIYYLVDVSHFPYIEIDTYDDLELANSIFPYNEPVWNQGGLHDDLLEKGKRNLDDALSLMKDFRDVCNKYNVRCWLNWGTLLGCYRDKTPMPWDSDIDISIDKANEEILWSKIVPEMKFFRCFVPNREMHCDNDCFLIRDFERLECNTVEKIGDRYIYSPQRCKLGCPAHHIDTLVELEVMGETFNIPSDTDNYLAGWYGNDWRIPKHGKPHSF